LIEQALYFAVGFLVALFAAVVATPVFSRRALRLASARAAIKAPASEKYAAGSTDALLARHAVETVRLKHKLAVAEDDSMRLRAIVGRQLTQLTVLRADVEDRERAIFDIRSERDEGIARRRDLEAALAASEIILYHAFAQRDHALNNGNAGGFRISELEAEVSRDRARIAILVAQTENLRELLKLAGADKERTKKSALELEDMLAAQRKRVGELEERLGGIADEKQKLRERMERAEVGLEEGRRRLAELESLLQRSEQIREEILIEDGRRLGKIAERDPAPIDRRVNSVDLGANHAAVGGEEVDVSESAKPNDAALRESIKNLGRQVSRLRAGRMQAHQDGGGPQGGDQKMLMR
jgi:chromosome segregation ATPase